MHPALWPYLVGLIPILLARSWPARIVALVFGLISVGLRVRHVWSINNSPDVITTVSSYIGRGRLLWSGDGSLRLALGAALAGVG